MRWKALLDILITIRKGSYKSLTDEQVSGFPRLFRQTCTDLAEARMLQLSPDVLDYLNSIVGQAHQYLYGFPAVGKGRMRYFFTDMLPSVLIRFRKYVAVSALFFFVPLIISFIVTYKNPEYAKIMMPPDVLEQMERSYETGIDRKQGAGMGAFAASYYISHNTSIAFLSFASGILLGIGTIFFLFYNGVSIGAVAGYIFSLGYGNNFLNFVCAHSVMELTGLVIAGAAGLMLGFSILRATRYSRTDWLKKSKADILTLLAPCVFLLAIAAFIEGNISPSAIPFAIKLIIALNSAGLLVFYFLIFPLWKKKDRIIY